MDGFEGLETERATLCLQYQEDVHPVYTVRGQESGESYECNRVREGWQLILQDSGSLPASSPMETEFLVTAVLYQDDDYVVTCTMPAQSPCGAMIRLEVKVRRLRENAGALTLKAAVQTPAFTDETGDHELTLELLDLCPKGEVTRSWYLRAQSVPAPESVMLANHESIQVWVSGDKRTVEENFALRAAVVEASAVQIVDQAVTSASLEMRNTVGGQKYVALAEIILQRTRNAYLIEEIRTIGVRQYIRTAATAALRQELEEWLRPGAAVPMDRPVIQDVLPRWPLKQRSR